MARNLHTASTFQVHYSPVIIPGGESQDILISLMAMCDVYTEDKDEFEVQRYELISMRNYIESDGSTDNEVIEKLQKLKMSKEELISALDRLINESDQDNEYVLLSWF